MIEVKLLKSFGTYKKGVTRVVTPERAKYWERIGLAKRYEKPKTNKKEKETKNDKPRVTSKSKGKS